MNKSNYFHLGDILILWKIVNLFLRIDRKSVPILIVKDTLGTVVYGTPSGKISGRIKLVLIVKGKCRFN